MACSPNLIAAGASSLRVIIADALQTWLTKTGSTQFELMNEILMNISARNNGEVPDWHLKYLEDREKAVAKGEDSFITLDAFEEDFAAHRSSCCIIRVRELYMLTSVKAEIDVKGNVRLLEPLEVFKTTKAIITLLDDNGNGGGSAKSVLDFLRTNRLPEGSRPTPEEIDAQIEEARNSWD